MKRNRVQFQPGLSMHQFMDLYGTQWPALWRQGRPAIGEQDPLRHCRADHRIR